VQLGDDSGSHEDVVVASEVSLSGIDAGLTREELHHLFSQMIQIERAGGAQVRQKGQPILNPYAVAIQILGGDGLHNDPLLLAWVLDWQCGRQFF
jgi:hypothetical protein